MECQCRCKLSALNSDQGYFHKQMAETTIQDRSGGGYFAVKSLSKQVVNSTNVNVLGRVAQSHMHCSVKNGIYKLAEGHQPVLSIRTPKQTTVLTPNAPDLLGISQLTRDDRQLLAEMGESHTLRLFNEHLLYAKDVPTFDAPDSHALRTLDQRCERWLRFEIVLIREHDVNSAEEKVNLQLATNEHLNVGQRDTLRLAVYDAADPAAVYMSEINMETFIQLTNGQNLMIQQFS